MIRPIVCAVVALCPFLGARAQSKVQCSCKSIAADGEGNTSCSVSESRGRCTIDYNLFGAESEKRATDILVRFGGVEINPHDPQMSADESLERLGSKPGKELGDAVLVYLTVAVGDQYAHRHETVSEVDLKTLAEAVNSIRSSDVAPLIDKNFGVDMRRKWKNATNEQLREAFSKRSVHADHVNGARLSPGCVEFTTSSGLWMMFKTEWSPFRKQALCEESQQSSSSAWEGNDLGHALRPPHSESLVPNQPMHSAGAGSNGALPITRQRP
jgi:hypothetical protein